MKPSKERSVFRNQQWLRSDDFKLGPADFTLPARAYGSTPAMPNWNPNCDINNDGKVGPYNFARLCADFGKHYP